MQVLVTERVLRFEAMAGGPATRKAAGSPPLFIDRPNSFIFYLLHPFTNPQLHSHCWGRAEQEEVVRFGGGGSTGARTVHGRSTAGSRAVYGRSGFVTGALAAVKRPQAAKGGLERPLWDRKRAAAT